MHIGVGRDICAVDKLYPESWTEAASGDGLLAGALATGVRVAARLALGIVILIGTLTISERAKANFWYAQFNVGGQAELVFGSNPCALAQQSFESYLTPPPGVTVTFAYCSIPQGPLTTASDATAHFVCSPPQAFCSNPGIAFYLGCDPGYQSIGTEGCVRETPVDPHCPFCVGDPIDPATGYLVQHFVDYQTAGPFPLKFERFYVNNDKPQFSAFARTMLDTMTGAWRSNIRCADVQSVPKFTISARALFWFA